jgi:hypothetical protein
MRGRDARPPAARARTDGAAKPPLDLTRGHISTGNMDDGGAAASTPTNRGVRSDIQEDTSR